MLLATSKERINAQSINHSEFSSNAEDEHPGFGIGWHWQDKGVN